MSITKRPSGRFQVRIRRLGFTQDCDTREEAEELERVKKSAAYRGAVVDFRAAESLLFRDAASSYAKKALPALRGGDPDIYRIATLVKTFGAYSLAAITPAMIQEYVERQSERLAPQSVIHEINMLTRIFKHAAGPRGVVLPRGIPTETVIRPKGLNKRTRLLVGDEEVRIIAAIKTAIEIAAPRIRAQDTNGTRRAPVRRGPNTNTLPLVQLAIEAATRQSELISLDWSDVHLNASPWPYMHVRGLDGRVTKNSDASRLISLSPRAVAILVAMSPKASGRVFSTTASALKQSWARAKRRARKTWEIETLTAKLREFGLSEADAAIEVKRSIVPAGRRPAVKIAPMATTQRILDTINADPFLTDLRYHDLRHEGTTRLAERLPIHKAMKMTGHKDVKTFLVYYQQRPEDVAEGMGWSQDDIQAALKKKT